MMGALLLGMTLLIQPGVDSPTTLELDPEIARARIRDVIREDVDSEERVATLEEVIERCRDSSLVSIAQLNLGVDQLQRAKNDPALIGSAIESFKAADRVGRSPGVQSDARFWLGQGYYELAQISEPAQNKDGGMDPQAMIDSMKKKIDTLGDSAGAFRSVLEVESSNTRASSNVERVRREIKELQDQIDALEQMMEQQKEQQRQEQQQKQQQQQDSADKLKELAQEQQKQAEESMENPPEDAQSQSKQQQDQQEVSEQTESADEEVGEQEGAESVSEKIQEAMEAQKKAQEAMENGDQEQAAKEQAKAAESLKEAAEQMQAMADTSKEEGEEADKKEQGESEEDADKQDGEGEEADQEQEDEELGDEISEIAKELLEKERREREMRQVYRQKGRPTKVEKDW